MATYDDIARMRMRLMEERRRRMGQQPQQVMQGVQTGVSALGRLQNYLQQKQRQDDAASRAELLDAERKRHNEAMEAVAMKRASRGGSASSEARQELQRAQAAKIRAELEAKKKDQERQTKLEEAYKRGDIEDPAPDMPDGDEDVYAEDLETPKEKAARVKGEAAEVDLERKKYELERKKSRGKGPRKPKRAKPKDLRAWTEAARVESRLSNVRGIAQDVGTGRIKAATSKVARAFGLAGDADFNQVQSRVMFEVNQAMKAMSGAAVSEQEMDRLLAAMPEPGDNADTFLIKLEEWVNQVRSTRLAEEFLLREAGIKVPNYDDFLKQAAPAAPPVSSGGGTKSRPDPFKAKPKPAMTWLKKNNPEAYAAAKAEAEAQLGRKLNKGDLDFVFATARNMGAFDE